MAQIDLRHAEIYLRDGYSKVGAVNQAGPAPANGDTSVSIDGVTGIIPIGVKMMFAGNDTVYSVTNVTGGATPTAVTFIPPLATADGIPEDNDVITFGPNFVRVDIGEGNLTFEEKRNINYVREKKSIDRGFVMTGDDEPMDVSLDFVWQNLSSDAGEAPTPKEAFNKLGAAANWVTSGSDPCEPYCIDIEIVYEPPCEGAKGERILLEEYRWESMSHDLRAGTMASKGKCKILLANSTRETLPIQP